MQVGPVNCCSQLHGKAGTDAVGSRGVGESSPGRTVRAEDARRARLILLLADGEPYSSLQSKLRCNRSYVSRWKGRFLRGGIGSL